MLLVTDVTGYVSKAVVAELAQQSVPVRVLAPEGASAAATIVDFDSPIYPKLATHVEWIRATACDPAALANALKGVDGVFLASPLSPKMADEHARVEEGAGGNDQRLAGDVAPRRANPGHIAFVE